MPKAIILAAGEGARLRPYTLDRPKCLVEIDGRSLLDRQLDVLRAEGVAPVVLVAGYMSEAFRFADVTIKLNPRFAETNMVWTLFCADEELVGEAIVSYGDIVYSKTILRSLLDSQDDIAVTVDQNWEAYWRARHGDPLVDAETMKLDTHGRILEVGKKPHSLDEIHGQYMGLMKFSQAGLDILRNIFYKARQSGSLQGKAIEKAYMTDLLQAAIDDGYHVQAVRVDDPWVEVDTENDLKSEVTRDRLRSIEQS